MNSQAPPPAKRRAAWIASLVIVAVGSAALTSFADRDPHEYEVHTTDRPYPEKVSPGVPSTQERPGTPPSDAIALFTGEEDQLENWRKVGGGSVGWEIDGDALKIIPDSGSIETRQKFGDVQLHVEWRANPDADGEGQHLSNSGVFFMDGRFEVQVLDTYENKTYPDGMAGAIYGQYPPLVNAMRPSDQWQTYDIIFRRPRFDDQGNLEKPARITVLHNGVLVQDCEKPSGPTTHQARPPYEPMPATGRIQLQDHGDNVMHFRNVWVRELDESRD